MLGLPERIVVYDTEYTAWEGSEARKWSGENEHREIVQIGAVLVETNRFQELDTFSLLVRPQKNPQLSSYFINLTGITQEELDTHGVPFLVAITEFAAWSKEYDLYAFGNDNKVLEGNAVLLGIAFPFTTTSFFDVRKVFEKYGTSTDGYMSSTIIRAFGKEPRLRAHGALRDAHLLVDALRELGGLRNP